MIRALRRKVNGQLMTPCCERREKLRGKLDNSLELITIGAVISHVSGGTPLIDLLALLIQINIIESQRLIGDLQFH